MSSFLSQFQRPLPAYTPVQPPRQLAQKAGILEEQLLKLDANENSFGAPKIDYQPLHVNLHIYPDPDQRRPRQVIG
jgi:histidinol-phosphate/aromatic aminotransferase/cobyric acid decarboxylase-like protein